MSLQSQGVGRGRNGSVVANRATGGGICEQSEWFAEDGCRLAARRWSASAQAVSGLNSERALVVIMHGYGDHSGRYDEVARSFVGQGFVVAAMDARGHGLSGGQRGYVDSFNRYVEDLGGFVNALRETHGNLPLFLLGHSQGGLVAVRAVQMGVLSLRGLIVTSAMFRLPEGRKPVGDSFARVLSRWVPRLPLPNGIRPEELTHDAEWIAKTTADKLGFSTATPRWYWEALQAGQLALQNAERIALPTLLVVGAQDPVVDEEASRQLFQALPVEDKQLWRRMHDRHEPLQEVGRAELMQSLARWMSERI